MSADVVEIGMRGVDGGARVWFDPIGIRVRPGQIVRWTNHDAGNAHTATAYHPANFDRPRRIPAAATPWDTDYLLPGETFSVTLRTSGVYDYYCIPHEHAGMVGRIIVGHPGSGMYGDGGLPSVALREFPSVADIMANGMVRPAAGR
ncbi:plastocyanin/azurin family copper-binding protein [Thalassobaculum sp.]|uniref:plastocyanin/azurin family copper-binding protein n=1 Tax=Thalassobaculum sp. TaxID=2022740 RepID=UPI0032EAEC75